MNCCSTDAVVDTAEAPLILIGPNFWILRRPFKVAHGLVDVGTHMGFIKLESGRFLVLDTVDILMGSKEKHAIDVLTNFGKLIDAVIATHPFHTMFFAPFNELYPGLPYFGTPRHLRNIQSVKWSGSLNDEAVRSKWEHEGIFMRIPDGTDFIYPTKHFAAVFVFHEGSKTLFVDDTLCYWQNPSFLQQTLLGARKGTLNFHSTANKEDLYLNAESPLLFLKWTRQIIVDWDFCNICTAHSGNLIGSGKEQLGILVEASYGRLRLVSEKIKRSEKAKITMKK